MVCVEHIMEKELITVNLLDSVRRAADLMDKFRIGGLPVLENKKLVGIITSRDVRNSHPNRLVADAMSKDVITVLPHYSIWRAHEIMEHYQIERLVVQKDGSILGLVTKSTLVNELGKHTDPLTGLNRVDFLYEKALDYLWQGKEIAIIFLDLDGFGAIDKDFGHVVGDSILCQTAHILKVVTVENVDYLCRYAGDEFAVLTVRPKKETLELAQRIVESLSAEECPFGIKLKGSLGVVGAQRKLGNFNENSINSISNLFNMASLASTRAKREKCSIVSEWVEL